MNHDLDHSLRDSVFWMVQIMEAWFLADTDALEEFYGQGFQKSAIRGNPNVEQISKQDVYDGLTQATRQTGSGEYHKTHHAPKLLGMISPDKARRAAPNCERLFGTALARLNG